MRPWPAGQARRRFAHVFGGRGLTAPVQYTSAVMAAGEVVRVLFIGAGAVNFGGAEGPWDHSRRLEQLEGVCVVAIANRDRTKAKRVLEEKLSGPHAEVYRECTVHADFKEALKTCRPDVAFIGVPPDCHGSLDESLDIELKCLQAGVHIFVEKPVSVVPPEKFEAYVEAVEREQRARGLVVSVGYMFRYHPAVEKMRKMLQQYGRPVMAINARYNCAYSYITRPFWWNTAHTGGPIVEQATHFCDLMRYLGGEVKPGEMSALCVEASDSSSAAGYLTSMPEGIEEQNVPPSQRVPRLTTAHWRFESGGVGTLTHGVVLHGKKYETSIDVWGDGLRMALEDPYFPECKLRIRGKDDTEEVLLFPDADPFLSEVQVFLAAVRSGDPSLVRSSYRDAANTYRLSWDIRRASEMKQA